MKTWRILGILASIAIPIILGIYTYQRQTTFTGEPIPMPKAHYVGSNQCESCHKKEHREWMGSHHERALDVASPASILGDFKNAEFTSNGLTSRFYTKDGKYYVHTQGVDGMMGDFQVTHTIGWYPLQQYLVPFPGGRLQCLTLAWDSRSNTWFDLYEDAPRKTDDWSYWTNPGQNWNSMCADCHSTNLLKNYSIPSDDYQTTWSEISVGCEACHGPGSNHLEWAKLPGEARHDRDNGLLVNTNTMNAREQAELCMFCHSRRTVTGDRQFEHTDMLDSAVPRLLREGLYYGDGQIQDEVYVYGSFTQSRMFDKNVRCTECHNVHSLKRHKEGNALCLQCHSARIYDTKDHHFHKYQGEQGDPIRSKDGSILYEVGSGAQCTACHMPSTTYMGNDHRLDHSLRIPRPDLTITNGFPNSCDSCHRDKKTQWSADFIKKWYGEKTRYYFGTTIEKARSTLPEAKHELISLVNDQQMPVIVRATALSLLSRYSGKEVEETFISQLNSPESLLRHSALTFLPPLPPTERIKWLAPLLDDPVLSVRTEAAMNLTNGTPQDMPDDIRESYQKAYNELIEILDYSADFPEARLNLGGIAAYKNDFETARQHFEKAIAMDPAFIPAYHNLAILHGRNGQNRDAANILRKGLTHNPEAQNLRYALGLTLAHLGEYAQATEALEMVAPHQPNNARLFFNLAQLYEMTGNSKAETAFTQAAQLDPNTPQHLIYLFRWQQRNGKTDAALRTARQLLIIAPRHIEAQAFIRAHQ